MEKNGSFLSDVVSGLAASPKRLSSKYFYDDEGDKLFHYIMNQPEYYLTCAEHEILSTYAEAIFSNIHINLGLRIIEPGAGDGFKTKLLINHLVSKCFDIIYNPIDISSNVLDILCKNMSKIFPQLICVPIVGDYFDIHATIEKDNVTRLLLFLGSNLGNYDHDEDISILRNFGAVLNEGDFLLLGVDFVKDPTRVLAAYNDANGITAKFNYNLLKRINRELGADFNVKNFMHYPVYDPVLHQAESYLISKTEHSVFIKAADQYFNFAAWEPLHTEISRKFDHTDLLRLAEASGFRVVNNYFDTNKDYCCSLWKKVPKVS
jgi:L-histidine Nalpha-methyltransferase